MIDVEAVKALLGWVEQSLRSSYYGQSQPYNGVPLCGSNLMGLNLNETKLFGLNLNGANLRGSCAVQSVFSQCQFRLTQAEAADWRNTRLADCDLYAADLRRLEASQTRAQDVEMAHVSAEEANFNAAVWQTVNAWKMRAVNSCFERAQLTDVDFEGAELTGTNFAESVCRRVSFRGAKLRGASFYFADIRQLDFREADLTGADFSGADVTGCDFTGAILEGVVASPPPKGDGLKTNLDPAPIATPEPPPKATPKDAPKDAPRVFPRWDGSERRGIDGNAEIDPDIIF